MSHVGVEAFFLPADPGQRFAVCYQPAAAPRGAVLFAAPFAEELNKSRRMIALQARALAEAGFTTLVVDLLGCGDSSGDFSSARWSAWKADLALGQQWLAARGHRSIHLWGLRLGALLALDFWREAPSACDGATLWQPVADGHTFMTQFLRLAVAADALKGGKSEATTETLRARMKAGQWLEIAGYELHPELVGAIDGLKLADLAPPGPLTWLDVRAQAAQSAPPAAQKVLERWSAAGATAQYIGVAGDAFWGTQEITVAPDLIAATTAATTAALSQALRG